MITNEPIRFLKELIPPLTPVLILGAFAVFVALTAEPTPPTGVPLPLRPYTELAAAIPLGPYYSEFR